MAPSDVLFKGLMGMNVFIVGIAIKEFVLDISLYFLYFLIKKKNFKND